RVRLLTIQGQLDLRGGRQALDVDALEDRALLGRLEQLVARGGPAGAAKAGRTRRRRAGGRC
ncbi:hypothetical protein OMR07_13605, partial [Methylobacterium organophilum]|nr:hypothetical protein [Methylobacterium organophilum]